MDPEAIAENVRARDACNLSQFDMLVMTLYTSACYIEDGRNGKQAKSLQLLERIPGSSLHTDMCTKGVPISLKGHAKHM